MKNPIVLIASASPKHLNSNFNLSQYVFQAAVQLLGEGAVKFSEFEGIADSISSLKPDICIIFGSVMPDECDYFLIKKEAERKSCKLAFWLHDDPYEIDASDKIKGIADYIFTNDKYSAYFYNHNKVFHLPLGGCPTHHFKELTEKKQFDIFFCGFGYSNRVNLVKDLNNTLSKYRTRIVGTNWPRFSYCKNSRISSSALIEYYNRSIITLNIGRHLNLANDKYQLPPSTPGPRTFEAALAGTVQFFFTETLEIENYFKPDEEIILFDDIKSFNEKLDRVYHDKEFSFNIAKNSQSRALREHCYLHRLQKLLSYINE